MYLLGFDIGGTKCAATLGQIISDLPKIIDKKYFLTEQKTPKEILDNFYIDILYEKGGNS